MDLVPCCLLTILSRDSSNFKEVEACLLQAGEAVYVRPLYCYRVFITLNCSAQEKHESNLGNGSVARPGKDEALLGGETNTLVKSTAFTSVVLVMSFVGAYVVLNV